MRLERFRGPIPIFDVFAFYERPPGRLGGAAVGTSPRQEVSSGRVAGLADTSYSTHCSIYLYTQTVRYPSKTTATCTLPGNERDAATKKKKDETNKDISPKRRRFRQSEARFFELI